MTEKYPRIKDLREDKDETQEQIAQNLGMYVTQYARYERGERTIPAYFINQLADYHKTSTDYIFGRTNKK